MRGSKIRTETATATHNTRDKFLEVNLNLCGKVSEVKRNRSEQVANFKTVNGLIKAQVGTGCNPFVLESLEQDSIVIPPEPVPVYTAKAIDTHPDVMSKVETIKVQE